jgi:hypothetical protein
LTFEVQIDSLTSEWLMKRALIIYIGSFHRSHRPQIVNSSSPVFILEEQFKQHQKPQSGKDDLQNILDEYDSQKKKRRLTEEKEELPSLVSQCVDWARVNSLKRLTLADVDTFVMEKELDLLNEIKRAMYAMTNVKLKSGK